MKKSELRDMIREVLKEELAKSSCIKEGAMNGGQAEGGFRDAGARAGGAKKTWKNALEGKKTKTVKAKDLKPGMVTDTGKVTKVTDKGNEIEVSYGGIGAQGSYACDNVKPDRDYEVLDEACDLKESSGITWDDLIVEADKLLDMLAANSGNANYDDVDGYDSGDGQWTNRYLYYTDTLNNSDRLDELCDFYSKKLPNVEFYYFEDDGFVDEAVSEIGYTATSTDYSDSWN